MADYQKISQFPAAVIYDALGKSGNLPFQIKPIQGSMRVCGPAFPVHTPAGMNTNLHKATAYAQPGDIIIADCSGWYETAYWGDMLVFAAMQRGIQGAVVDGFIRDADEIEAMGFSVFCRGLCLNGAGKGAGGSLNKAIIIGGVHIHPGDIVIGDRDGVVIVPANQIEETIEKAIAIEQKEAGIRERFKNGETSLQVFGWEKK